MSSLPSRAAPSLTIARPAAFSGRAGTEAADGSAMSSLPSRAAPSLTIARPAAFSGRAGTEAADGSAMSSPPACAAPDPSPETAAENSRPGPAFESASPENAAPCRAASASVGAPARAKTCRARLSGESTCTLNRPGRCSPSTRSSSACSVYCAGVMSSRFSSPVATASPISRATRGQSARLRPQSMVSMAVSSLRMMRPL